MCEFCVYKGGKEPQIQVSLIKKVQTKSLSRTIEKQETL